MWRCHSAAVMLSWTHPERTPKTRFSTKKEPMIIRGMKYMQFHVGPKASLVCRDKKQTADNNQELLNPGESTVLLYYMPTQKMEPHIVVLHLRPMIINHVLTSSSMHDLCKVQSCLKTGLSPIWTCMSLALFHPTVLQFIHPLVRVGCHERGTRGNPPEVLRQCRAADGAVNSLGSRYLPHTQKCMISAQIPQIPSHGTNIIFLCEPCSNHLWLCWSSQSSLDIFGWFGHDVWKMLTSMLGPGWDWCHKCLNISIWKQSQGNKTKAWHGLSLSIDCLQVKETNV